MAAAATELRTQSRSCSSAQANHRPNDQRVDIINARECQGSIHGMKALRHFIIIAAGYSMTNAAVTVIKKKKRPIRVMSQLLDVNYLILFVDIIYNIKLTF